MAHTLGPITSASATACSKDSPCFLLQPRNQAYRRHGHDHAPPALFRAAASLQQNHRRTTHTAANRAICSRSQRHSVRSFLACPQRRGCQIDQIAIGRTRGPRFRATKVSATPPTFSARPQPRRGVAETSPFRAICSRSQRHSVRSFLACPQRRGCQIDQIAIGRNRGPRFRATKVSATPPTFSARPQPRRGVAETSPLGEIADARVDGVMSLTDFRDVRRCPLFCRFRGDERT